VVFPGSNCDKDAAHAIRETTGDTVDLVWHDRTDLAAYDAIVLPGGFSYGDYLRSGAIARFSPVVEAVKREAEQGKLVLGICNGFQVLTESHLLPGALLRNDHLQFRCSMTELVVENNASPFTCGYEVGDRLQIPIAHGEGRFTVDETVLQELSSTARVAFTYEENPNGSTANIAGILNKQGNVLGMMPHPERAITEWMDSTDGRRIFESMHRFVEEGRQLVGANR
jgi:phosphoribosylformylglycinamidine synthase subunit PurQ / glutaminase